MLPNSTGKERAGQITIIAGSDGTRIPVFIFQNSNIPLYHIRVTQETEGGWEFGYVRLLKNNKWWPGDAPKPYEVEASPQTMMFSYEFSPNATQKFYSVNFGSSTLGYQNYAKDLPLKDTYTGKFKQKYDAVLRAEFPELAGVSNVEYLGNAVGFKDPWYTDRVDNLEGELALQNSGLSANFYYTTNNEFSLLKNTSYKGVFKDLYPQSIYFYLLKFPATRTLKIGNTSNVFPLAYFINTNAVLGSSTLNSGWLESPVTFTGNSSVKAYYKGLHISNSTSALTGTNQRKFVRSGNGMLHLVYESMDKVWYETSTDNGANWKIMNGGKPLSVNNSQFPSITLDDINWAYITYYNSEYGYLEMQCFNYNTDVKIGSLSYSFYVEHPQMTPVISCDTQGDYLIITFKANYIDDLAGIYSPGLYSRLANYNSSTHVFEWKGGLKKITGTDENSFYPAMDCYIPKYAPYVYHLAWQQNTETATSQIKYCKLTNTNGVITQNDDATVSNLSYANNSAPTVIVLKDGIPRVSWTAVNGLTKRAMLRGRTSAPGNPWSGTFSSFGSNVTSVNINKHLTGTVGGYILGWNQSTASWFIRNTNFNEIVNTSLFGSNLQISNGTVSQDFSIMYGIVFDASNLPYYFQQSPALNVNPPLSKESSDNLILETRAAVVTTEDNKYTYSIGNIIADDVSINFKEVSDTVSSFNIMELNNIMITEEFSISDESNIRFSIVSQVRDSLKAVAELQDNNVTFRAELIDADQQKVLYILDELKFNETTGTFNDTKNYELNTAGLGTRTVKVRLVTENSFPAKFYIENHYDQTFLLEKEKYVELTNYQNNVINDYDLFQNYPNPFNPATTIRYQLPKAGFVTLKIFDMIGKEVAVLADGFKQEGQYTVDFNAGNLSSGLYFYELKVNDFSATKKMMMIK